jgi:Fe2+ or Zn2+ uptake regulation protein
MDERPLILALDRAGYRLTKPRRAVAQLIAAREGHFSAAGLLDDARARRLGIARATVFRALDLFTELDLLERLDLPTGDHAYLPCERAYHHHHIVCSTCGRTTPVEDAGLAVERIQRRTGWQVESHRLELYGRCPRCRAVLPSRAVSRSSATRSEARNRRMAHPLSKGDIDATNEPTTNLAPPGGDTRRRGADDRDRAGTTFR